jgi:Concanavalin A-like lectin/glucanases superfamily
MLPTRKCGHLGTNHERSYRTNMRSASPGYAQLVAGGMGDANDIQGSNNGTLLNGATFGPGKVGQAFSFDGINDYVQASDSGLPLGSAPRTLELWMKAGSNVVEVPAIYGNFSGDDAFYIVMINNQTCIGRWGGGDICGSSNIRDDNWHHVALTYDGVNLAQLFIDGSLETSATRTYSTTSRGKSTLGLQLRGAANTMMAW